MVLVKVGEGDDQVTPRVGSHLRKGRGAVRLEGSMPLAERLDLTESIAAVSGLGQGVRAEAEKSLTGHEFVKNH